MPVCISPYNDHYFTPIINLRIKQSLVHQLTHLFFSKIEVVKNSTSGNEWTSIDLKWRGPEKHPAGKITIRYSGTTSLACLFVRSNYFQKKITLNASSIRNLKMWTTRDTKLKKSSTVTSHRIWYSKFKRTDVIFNQQQQK